MNGKKIAGILVIAAVLLGAAGYFLYVPQLEKKQEEQVAEVIAALPGDLKAESIKASFLDKSLTITKLAGKTSYLGVSEVALDIGKIVIKDINFTAGIKTGEVKIVGEMLLENGSYEASTPVPAPGHPVTQSVHFANASTGAVFGDLQGLAAALGKDVPFAQMIKAVSSLRINNIKVQDYTVTSPTEIGPVSVAVKEMTTAGTQVLSSVENCRASGFTVSALGSKLVEMDAFTLASASMPDIFTPLGEALQKGSTEEELTGHVLTALGDKPIQFKGLGLKNMRFQMGSETGVSIADILMDFEFSSKTFALKKDIKGLSVSPDLYALTSPEIARFAAVYGKPLLLDANLDVKFTVENGHGVVTLNNFALADANLAGMSAKGSLSLVDGKGETLAQVSDSTSDVALVKGELTLNDTALVGLVLSSEPQKNAPSQSEESAEASEQGASAEAPAAPVKDEAAMRKEAAEMLRGTKAPEEGNERNIVIEAVAKLIEAPGTVRITLSPEQPVLLDNPEGKLNATAEYTPTKQ